MNTRLKATLLLSMFLFVPSLFAHKIPIDTSCAPITDDSPYIHYFQLHVHEPTPTPPATRSPRSPTPPPRSPTPPPRSPTPPPRSPTPPPRSPTPPPRSPTPPPSTETETMGDCSASENETEYIMNLRKGHNRVSIPLSNPAIGCNAIEHLSDFMDALGDNASYAYGVNDDRFKYVAGEGYDADYVCDDCTTDREITPSYGFVVVMREAVEMTIVGTPITEHDMTILKGYRIYGFPVNDDRIETIDDMFDVFPNISWMSYHTLDGESRYNVFANSDEQKPILGGTAYFIQARSDLTVALSGEAWEVLTPTAPPAVRMSPKRLTTTWGAMKR